MKIKVDDQIAKIKEIKSHGGKKVYVKNDENGEMMTIGRGFNLNDSFSEIDKDGGMFG